MTALTVVLAVLPIDRDAARDAARRELSKRIYQPPERSWVVRAIEWLTERLSRALDRASSIAPGGLPGLVLLVVLVIALVVLLRWRLGPLRRSGLLDDVRGMRTRTADDYRDEAAAFAAQQNWREALRARFRAVIRELEQRGVLDQRAGRTAGEIAVEAAVAMPAVGVPIRRAADVFNEVWYGDRPATEAAYQSMVDVDETIRGARRAALVAGR